jgi:hypothetical protein
MSPLPATCAEYVYIMQGTGKVKLSLSTTRGHIGDIEVWLHTCLTLALGGGELQRINITLINYWMIIFERV